MRGRDLIYVVVVVAHYYTYYCLLECQLVVSVCKSFEANQIVLHSRSNAVVATVKYPVAISGAFRHFGRIRNGSRIVNTAVYLANRNWNRISVTSLLNC